MVPNQAFTMQFPNEMTGMTLQDDISHIIV